MYYTGFADEAGASIDIQIQATKELGWTHIEARGIDGVNLTDISDEKFDEVCGKLASAGVRVSCFGSAIANWGRDPRKEDDFCYSLEALQRALPRMLRLGTTMIRGMSFAILKDQPPDSPELEKVIFSKVRQLVHLCERAGVIYLHENCMNYGGLSYRHTLRLLEAVDSPNFKLVFDTGNLVGSDLHLGQPPYRKQSSWEFYCNVRQFIHSVHIKDCTFVEETGGTFPKLKHTFPGEGHGDVKRIVANLLANGYGQSFGSGGFSIEPHLDVVYHDDSLTSPDDIRYANYVEYGRRLMKLVEEARSLM